MGRKAKRITELKEKAKRYFEECDALNSEARETAKNKDIRIPKPYTVSGLVYSLGLTRQEFERLSLKPDYAFLADAKMRIEAFIEENSLNGGLSCNASATSLKQNFGWGKEQTVESTEQSSVVEVVLSDEAKRLAQ